MEVMGLREQSDTYLQNLETLKSYRYNIRSRCLSIAQPPNMNDLILDPSVLNEERFSSC